MVKKLFLSLFFVYLNKKIAFFVGIGRCLRHILLEWLSYSQLEKSNKKILRI